jgi:diaminopimelate decarboxylase
MLDDGIETQIRQLATSGPTPFYLYDLAAVQKRISELKSRLPNDVDIFYSAKANSHPRFLKQMKACNVQIDVASLGELERAISIGFLAQQISFTGPGKRSAEIARAVEYEVGAIVVESFDELKLIESHAIRMGKTANIAPRLTPEQRIGHTGRLIVGEPSQFGFDESNLLELAKRIDTSSFVRLVGTHSHVQSQMLHHEHVVKNFEFALETSLLFQSHLKSPKLGEYFRLCLGGGFGIPYTGSATPLDLDQVGMQFQKLIAVSPNVGPKGVKFKFAVELGRYLVGEAGYFVASLLSKKTARGADRTITYAIADGGYSQCQIACGVGQVVRTNLPFAVLKRDGRERASGTMLVSIAGPTCHSQDLVIREALLDGIEVGDLLVVRNVGAYGKQFSPTEFLLMPEAEQHFIEVQN